METRNATTQDHHQQRHTKLCCHGEVIRFVHEQDIPKTNIISSGVQQVPGTLVAKLREHLAEAYDGGRYRARQSHTFFEKSISHV